MQRVYLAPFAGGSLAIGIFVFDTFSRVLILPMSHRHLLATAELNKGVTDIGEDQVNTARRLAAPQHASNVRDM
jgi:hypothetical protein